MLDENVEDAIPSLKDTINPKNHNMNIKELLEKYKDKGDLINDIVESRGVYDGGKSFRDDWTKNIYPMFKEVAIDLLQEEIEYLKGKKKIGHMFSSAITPTGYENIGYNQAIDDQITNLLSEIKEIKSL